MREYYNLWIQKAAAEKGWIDGEKVMKAYLKEKYSSKLVIAEQGGLWKADAQTIGFLNSFSEETLVIIDTFDNPVKSRSNRTIKISY